MRAQLLVNAWLVTGLFWFEVLAMASRPEWRAPRVREIV